MYKIQNISETTIDAYKNCFDINGSPKSEEKIRWQFLQTPINKKFVDIAIDEEKNKVAAIYAISPVQFRINQQFLIGSQSLDTITDMDYRGKGLFINLAKSVYKKASEENVKLVYGFPNGNSIQGFSKKLDWQVLDPVPFLIKPLYSSYFTKKIKQLSWFPNIKIGFKSSISKQVTIKEEFDFPDDVDNIWDVFSKDIKVTVERNKEYLTWRYLKKPKEDYKILHSYTSNGQYIGFIVYCVKGKHGGKIAYIMEFIYDPKFQTLAQNLLKKAVNNIIAEKADCILSWCLEHSTNYQAYKKTGFYNLPQKLRPIELHFGATTFDSTLENTIYKRENWFLSYSDSDTV